MLEIAQARELLDRHPPVQRIIQLRNPDVDPINALQVELLQRWRDPDVGTASAASWSGRWPARSRESRPRCATPADRFSAR